VKLESDRSSHARAPQALTPTLSQSERETQNALPPRFLGRKVRRLPNPLAQHPLEVRRVVWL
jgi:hypothetical protein